MKKKYQLIKKISILLFSILLTTCTGLRKNQELNVIELHQNSDVYLLVDTMPVFLDDPSEQKLNDYLQSKTHLKLSGKVKKNKTFIVQYIIDKDGSISFYQILEGPNNLKLRNEVDRMFDEMPNWTPGSQDGQSVKISKRIIISFK